jgi:hypothetical protein
MIDHPSQHYLFAYKALPTIFYTQGRDFLFYLDRDGKKFLKFWWDHAAEKLEESQLRSPEGLSFEVHDYKNRKLVLIILPPPDAEEVYFLAMLSRPSKNHILIWKNLARVIALQRRVISAEGKEAAVLVDITPRQRQVDIGGATCPPHLKDFYKKVQQILGK